MNGLWAAVAGALVGLGVLVAAVGVFAADQLPVPVPDRRRAGNLQAMALRVGGSLLVGLVAWSVTGWPVGGLLVAMGAAAAPSVFGAKGRRAAEVAKVEAIATWAEQLRDVMAAADGIQSAIQVTASTAPAPIRPEVRRLADRLAQRQGLRASLSRFAAEVDHAMVDTIVVSLRLAAETQGGQLTALLGEVASTARATASMRLRVEATRARTYVTTRLIVGVTVGMVVWLVTTRRDYLAPFDSWGGQIMLGLIGALFAVSAVAMQRMANPTREERLLSVEVAS